MKYSVLNWISPLNTTTQGSGKPVEERRKKNVRARAEGGSQGNKALKIYSIEKHMNSQRITEEACTRTETILNLLK